MALAFCRSVKRTAECHCGRVTLMCEVGSRARPDCRRQIGIHHSDGGWGEPQPGSRPLQQRDEPALDLRADA